MAGKTVDAHQHFWRYDAGEFGWISDEMGAIRRDFVPGDLRPELDAAGVDATVVVQARQSLEETDWLLGLAAENAWIAGVVGWVPLVDEGVGAVLERYNGQAKLKGVRHVLQAEADAYFAREDFNRGLGLLKGFGLTYDVLVLERQLGAAIALIDRHPGQKFVVDHVAKPRIGDGVLEPWRSQMLDLGRRGNVCCKLSGMVTEADFGGWTEEQLWPYVETALEAFGAERLMFGSDWPVCRVAASYGRWLEVVLGFVGELSAEEQSWVMGGTAIAAYELKF
jgi:L-fuconolactonase